MYIVKNKKLNTPITIIIRFQMAEEQFLLESEPLVPQPLVPQPLVSPLLVPHPPQNEQLELVNQMKQAVQSVPYYITGNYIAKLINVDKSIVNSALYKYRTIFEKVECIPPLWKLKV